MTMVDLLNATLHEEMRRNPAIVVFGEDVADCSREAALSEVKERAASSKSPPVCSANSARGARSTAAGGSRHRGRAIGMATRG